MNTAGYLAYFATICAGMLAVASALRVRRSVCRWAFVLGMAALAAEAIFIGVSFSSTAAADLAHWQRWRLFASCSVVCSWWIFARTYARGLSAREALHNAWLLVAALVGPVVLWFGRDDLIALVTHTRSPAGWIVRLGWLGYLLQLGFLAGSIAVVLNLERTFRASVGTMRWRIKFALFGIAVIFITRIYTSSEVLLFRGSALPLEIVNCGALIVATPLLIWSFFRAGHVDLDVYPSGQVLRNSLTILLTGIYLLVVGVLAKVVALLGGDAAFGLKAFVVLVALVALALGLQSERLRWRLRRFVSDNFKRPLHDYAVVWKRVTEATASRVEQSELSRALATVIADVFHAHSVRIWVTNDKKDTLAVAAATTTAAGTRMAGEPIAANEIAAHFMAHPAPVDLDAANHTWCAALRERHPADFSNGGHRICVPLFGRGEFLGMITIADRVGGTPFAAQDLELLKSIAEHAAASLLNIQLSQRLLEAKQLEAFQSMAAFFVHDLKNAASTLSLTLRNLPTHFDDPEFRADALRGIGKTVEHINRLIGRLTALRHELTIRPAVSDLNELVAQVLSGFEQRSPAVIKDIHPVPRIPFDREQIEKVLTNLVLNATEAVSADGQVRVTTGQQNGWVVLTVDDNGCGMSEEFMNRSLFRPFQTTKKAGLGIGMFQSKMIVEAHGGRIAVKSQPGSGTRFEVFLRASAAATQPHHDELE